MKKKVWFAPLIVLVSSIVLAVSVFGLATVWARGQIKKEHKVPEKFIDADNSGNLYERVSFQLADGRYIVITDFDNSDVIAFISDEDNIEIEFAKNSYNPVSYFNDDYETMDIAQEYFEYMEYSLYGDESAEVITDISEIDPESSYTSPEEYGTQRGSVLISQYEDMKEIKAYDFNSSYLGFENPLVANGAALGGLAVGVGAILLAFVIVVVGILSALITLIVNLCINASTKKKAQQAGMGG